MNVLLTEEQEIVLGVIQDYLDKNRTFELDKIIPIIRNTFARTSININNNGIKNILQFLLENKYITQGSKLTKEMILNNKNRKDIYYLIKTQPGIISNQIRKELTLTQSVLIWHLNILIKFGCIKKIRIKNHNAFFHFKIEKSVSYELYLLSNRKINKIIQYIKDFDEGVTKTKISKELGIDFGIVSKYFNSLKEFGILKQRNISRKKIYKLSDKYYNLFDKFYQIQSSILS